MRWPSVSLTFLNRSRSMNSTPTRRPLRLACAMACPSRSCSSRRLGRPVSASRVARYCSRSSAWMRELTSCTNDRMETMRPCSSSRHEWYHSHQMVCGVLAVVAVETRRARLLAGHQLVDQRDHLVAIRLVRQLAAGDRHAEHFLGAPPEDMLSLRRPAHQAKIAVPLQHRQRRIVDVRGQHPVGAAQRFLVALLVVDIGVHRVDADDVALGVAVRRVVDRFPALLAIGLQQQLLGRHRLARQTRASPAVRAGRRALRRPLRRCGARSGPCGSPTATPRCAGSGTGSAIRGRCTPRAPERCP